MERALVSEDVNGAYTRALESGCTSLSAPADQLHDQRVAWVRDPFGTLLELATPL